MRKSSTFVRFVRFVVEKERGGLSGMKNIREIGYAELTQHASTGLFNLRNLNSLFNFLKCFTLRVTKEKYKKIRKNIKK